MKNIESILKEINIEYRRNVSLSAYTTIGAGGPAAYLAEIKELTKLELLLTAASANNISFLILGKGSNVIISDDGFDGLVIINKTNSVYVKDEMTNCISKKELEARLDSINEEKKKDLSEKNVVVRSDSGLTVTSLAHKLYEMDISGLEWFSGIPSSVGGAVYMNMHGGYQYFGDLVLRAKLFSGKSFKLVDNEYFKFDYDYSILHTTKEIVLWVDLCLPKGGVEKAKKKAKEWAKEKSNQPQRSAGCIFKNLTMEEKEKANLPSVSIGYLVDNLLGLKGFRIGGAQISPRHAAFIENTGNATAADIYQLVNHIKKSAKEKLKINLKTEIEFIGNF